MKISIHQYLTLIVTEFVNTLAEEKKSAKYDEFLPVMIFFADYFFTDNCFYRRLIFTDKYCYRHFFFKREHLVFSNLKISLDYLFDFKID